MKHAARFCFKILLTLPVVSGLVAMLSVSPVYAASCANVPTLMYHHVQNLQSAKAGGFLSLDVTPEFFQKQMQYLKDKHYTVISMQDLVNFFNSNTPLPSKPILITFDDGYDDFSTRAVPILNAFHYPATLFDATGLMENPRYLTWSQIKDAASSGKILIANHTWSHHSMNAANSVIEREITTAENQLHEKGYDSPKVFAYPYGSYNGYAKAYLQAQGFQVAFTTKHGTNLCTAKRFELPRVRIGNAQLNSYHL